MLSPRYQILVACNALLERRSAPDHGKRQPRVSDSEASPRSSICHGLATVSCGFWRFVGIATFRLLHGAQVNWENQTGVSGHISGAYGHLRRLASSLFIGLSDIGLLKGPASCPGSSSCPLQMKMPPARGVRDRRVEDIVEAEGGASSDASQKQVR